MSICIVVVCYMLCLLKHVHSMLLKHVLFTVCATICENLNVFGRNMVFLFTRYSIKLPFEFLLCVYDSFCIPLSTYIMDEINELIIIFMMQLILLVIVSMSRLDVFRRLGLCTT